MKALAPLLAVAVMAAGAAAFHFASTDEPDIAGVHTVSQAPTLPLTPTVPPVVPSSAEQDVAAPPPRDDEAALDRIGRAQLAQGIDAKRDGNPEKARRLLEAAAASLGKSIELGGERVDPWTLASMAQAQVELGNGIEAMAWADRALQQLRQGSNDDYTQFRAAQLTMSMGIVYYRAGQKQTGIAYMDQAMSMAPTEFDRADFSDLKDETIGG